MRKVSVRSDMSNRNVLTIIEQDDGDIVLETFAPLDELDRSVEICTEQGGSRLKNHYKIIKHFSAIIDLLMEENDEIVGKLTN